MCKTCLISRLRYIIHDIKNKKKTKVEEFSGLSLGKGECKRMDLLSVEGVIQI